MEHWEAVSLGVVAAFIGLGVIFFFFDKLLQRMLGDRNKPTPGRGFRAAQAAGYAPLQQFQGMVALGKLRNPQVNHLLNDPYRSDEHEVICIVVQDREKGVVAGMSALLNDGVVDWFVERVGEEMDSCTALLTAVEKWCRQWQGAETVFLLCEDKQVVRDANIGRLDPLNKLTDYELENNFKLNFQWSENFHCHDPDFRDLMESFPSQARRLLTLSDREDDSPTRIWSGFLLSHWDLVRVRVPFEVPTAKDLIPVNEVSS